MMPRSKQLLLGFEVTLFQLAAIADGSLPPSHDGEALQAYREEGTPLRPSGRVDLAAAFFSPGPPARG